jgi:hypothetical protein
VFAPVLLEGSSNCVCVFRPISPSAAGLLVKLLLLLLLLLLPLHVCVLAHRMSLVRNVVMGTCWLPVDYHLVHF